MGVLTVDTKRVLVIPHQFWVMKQGEGVIWLSLKINLSTTLSMKKSRRELSIDMIIYRSNYKNNQIRLTVKATVLGNAIPALGVKSKRG